MRKAKVERVKGETQFTTTSLFLVVSGMVERVKGEIQFITHKR